jgi:hypothetical protein
MEDAIIIQDLRKQIQDLGKQIKFPMKLFILLEASIKYPNIQETIGIKWFNDKVFCFHSQNLPQFMGCQLSNIRKALKKNQFQKHSDVRISQHLSNLKKYWRYSMSNTEYFNSHSTRSDIQKVIIPKFFTKEQKQMFRRIGISVEQYSYLQTKIHQFPLLSNSLQIGITYFSKWIEQNLEKREKNPLTLSFDQLINGSGNEVFKYRFAQILSHFLFNDNGQNINGPTEISNFDLLKLFLRFGKDTPFDFLTQFIRTDSENELICSDGFSIFENTFSAAQRLKQSESQWIIIPDSTEFGFYLFVQNNQNIQSYHIFPLRPIELDLKHQIINALFI